jgi:hypothetical protein
VDTILLEADGCGSFTFRFSSSRGDMSGRVHVGIEGPPDRRSTPGYVAANFAIKTGYFFVGALVLIFVGMLVLTIYP